MSRAALLLSGAFYLEAAILPVVALGALPSPTPSPSYSVSGSPNQAAMDVSIPCQVAASPQPSLSPSPGVSPGLSQGLSSNGSGCMIGIGDCRVVKAATLSQLDARISTQIEGYYEGMDLDFSSPNPLISPAPFASPVCNVLAAETATNNGYTPSSEPTPVASVFPSARPPQSCGAFMTFHQNGTDFTGAKGSRERAYSGGAWIQAIRCYQAQVEQEIQNGAIHVSPNSACYPLAQDVQNLVSNQSNVVLNINGPNVDPNLKQAFCSQAEGSETGSLATQADGTQLCNPHANDQNTPDQAQHWMSACYAQSAKSSIEAAFGQLAACEIFNRADSKFQQVMGAPWTAQLTTMENNCDSQAQNAANESHCIGISFVSYCWTAPNPVRYQQYYNQCYQQNYPKILQTYLTQHFPSTGLCQ